MAIQRVGIVGGGQMGGGVAEVMAKAGLETVVREVDAAAAERSPTFEWRRLRSEEATTNHVPCEMTNLSDQPRAESPRRSTTNPPRLRESGHLAQRRDREPQVG